MSISLRLIAPASLVLLLAGSAFAQEQEEEQAVPFGDLPAAVQATFTAEVPSPEAAQFTSETEDGQTTYEAEWTAEGFENSVEVDANGAVLEREQESLSGTSASGEDEAEDEDDDAGQAPGGGCCCAGTPQAACTCQGAAQQTCPCRQ